MRHFSILQDISLSRLIVSFSPALSGCAREEKVNPERGAVIRELVAGFDSGYETPGLTEVAVRFDGTLCQNSSHDFSGGNETYNREDFEWQEI